MDGRNFGDDGRISSRYAPYILWGTDFFLVRQRLRESSYWYFFEQMLDSKEFDTISRENSNRFLKLPTNTKMGKSIKRYMKFILSRFATILYSLLQKASIRSRAETMPYTKRSTAHPKLSRP